MKKTAPKKLILTRESLRNLERQELGHVPGAANTAKCNTAVSCQVGCANYTRFGTCTC